MSKIRTELSRKEDFARMMYKLAGHFHVSKDNMTDDYINEYWIALCDYTNLQIGAGMRHIWQTKSGDSFFPNVADISKAILQTLNRPDQKMLLPPEEKKPDAEDKTFHQLNLEWWKWYFGADMGLKSKEVTPADKDGNCPILANNSRVKYVQGRLSEGSRYKT